MSKIIPIFAAASLVALTGCSIADYQRNDGVTGYAGNAIAANTVLQMVDPWPAGVEDTDIKTNAKRLSDENAAASNDKKPVRAESTTD